MDVAVTDLRANLSDWLGRVRSGEEVVVTDRGVPIVRLVAISTTPTIERLIDDGVIGRPDDRVRPTAAARTRPRSRRPVADIVSKQRR